ncbi:MAG: SPOR domain-containing protein [Ruminobacter sp.]|nr:SPOR domain-containing protein [Ruminobacter sp.]
MISQFTRVIVGACVLLVGVAWFVPKLFPSQDQKSAVINVTKNTNEVDEHKSAQDGHNQEKNNQIMDSFDEDDSMEDESYGYGNLLDDEGSNPPADYYGEDANVKTGIVVGTGNGTESKPRVNNNFVDNPTATGNTPAQAAKAEAEREKNEAARREQLAAREEAERQAREEKNRIENERKLAEAKVKAEAERRQAEADRKLAEAKAKAEADRKLAEARAKAEADRKLAEARAKAEADRKLAEAKAKAEAERKAAEARAQAQQTAANGKKYYLQIGSYSTKAQAEQERQKLRGAKIPIEPAYRQYLDGGFGYQVVQKNGKHVLVVGPAKSDVVLRHIKPRIDGAVGTSSFVTNF